MKYNGKAYVEDPVRGNKILIKIDVGKVFCNICGRGVTLGMLPGEQLIDLYHYWHDDQMAIIWYEIGLNALFERWFTCDQRAYERHTRRLQEIDFWSSGVWSWLLFEYQPPEEAPKVKKRARRMRSKVSKDVEAFFKKDEVIVI
jgi:hypothetical protein